MAKEIQLQNGSASNALANAIKVIVDGDNKDGWMAQGLEIDYFACAKSEKTVRENFVEGLQKTIKLNLEKGKDVKRLLTPAPKEVWAEYYAALSNELSAQVYSDDSMFLEHLGIGSVAFIDAPNRNRNYNQPQGS